MGRITNFLAGLLVKVDPTWSLKFSNQIGRPVFNTQDYKTAAKEGYMINDVVYSSIDKFAKNFAQIDFKLFEIQGNTKRELEQHALLDLLATPNTRQSKEEFMEELAAVRIISGNPYINANGPFKGDDDFKTEPTELFLLRPDRVKIVPGEVGIIRYEYSVNTNEPRIFPADSISGKSNILHWPTYHPLDDLYGFAPLMAAGMSIDSYNEAMQWNMAFFQNGTRPSGALVYNPKEGNGILPEPAFDRLKKQLMEQYSGAMNNGKPLFLDGGMEWKSMSLNPKDIDFEKGLNFQARNISRVIGVPPLLLNIPGDNTYNNMENAKLGFWDESIIPWGKAYTRQLNYWLVPRFGDNLLLIMDLSKVTALEPRRKALWERANTSKFITINEKRKMVDFEPVDGGDVVYISSSEIPITFDLSEQNVDQKAFEYKLDCKATRADLERERIIQERLMTLSERGFVIRMFNQLEKTSRSAEKEFLKSNGVMDVQLFLKDATAPMTTLIGSHYSSTYDSFGKRIIQGLKAMPSSLDTKDQEGIFQAGKMEFVNGFTLDKVTEILETTRKQIQKAIDQGTDSGATLGQIATDIRDNTGGEIARNRAITIASTETHTAAQSGSHGGASATGLELKRIWSAADDKRVRTSHKDAEKDSLINPKGMEERFNIGSPRLLFPGDPIGSAKDIINCRCVVIYQPAAEL